MMFGEPIKYKQAFPKPIVKVPKTKVLLTQFNMQKQKGFITLLAHNKIETSKTIEICCTSGVFTIFVQFTHVLLTIQPY